MFFLRTNVVREKETRILKPSSLLTIVFEGLFYSQIRVPGFFFVERGEKGHYSFAFQDNRRVSCQLISRMLNYFSFFP